MNVDYVKIVSQLDTFVAKIPLGAISAVPMQPIAPLFSAVAPLSPLSQDSPLSSVSSSSSPSLSSPPSPLFPAALTNAPTDQTCINTTYDSNGDPNFVMERITEALQYPQPQSSCYETLFNPDMTATNTPFFVQAQPTTTGLYYFDTNQLLLPESPNQLLIPESHSLDLSSVIAGDMEGESELSC